MNRSLKQFAMIKVPNWGATQKTHIFHMSQQNNFNEWHFHFILTHSESAHFGIHKDKGGLIQGPHTQRHNLVFNDVSHI